MSCWREAAGRRETKTWFRNSIPVPPSPEEVQALVQAVETARSLIATALEALTVADEALRTTAHVLNRPGDRGKIHPPIGVIEEWETAAVLVA